MTGRTASSLCYLRRCRQVLNEAAQVGRRDLTVYCSGLTGGAIMEYRLSELLPHAFGPASLGMV